MTIVRSVYIDCNAVITHYIMHIILYCFTIYIKTLSLHVCIDVRNVSVLLFAIVNTLMCTQDL